MMGNNQGVNFEFLKAHAEKITVEEAIGDLPVLHNGDMIDAMNLPPSSRRHGMSFYR